MKDTIFISHANPQNNYFSAWLASKLRLLGYKVWVDVKEIKPGQYFNRDFEKVIREESIRFLAVVSNDYLLKSKQDDTGVMNEILCARTIKDIDGFIIPLLYDDSDYNEFTVGLRGRQAISFNKNWAAGLHELVSYFEEVSIPKNEMSNSIIHFWHESQKIKSEPLNKPEKYFTNWFPIGLPHSIYIHQPELLNDADFAFMPFVYIREGDRLISLVSSETFERYTKLRSSKEIPIETFFNRDTYVVDDKFRITDPNRKLVKLLNKVFRNHLVKRQLKKYDQANKKEIFYFGYSAENLKQVSLKQLGKTRRTVIGKTSEFVWHFAISHSAALHPSPSFRIFYHLFFTDNNGKPLPKDDQQELRRSMPSDWFNRKWLETLLAMMIRIGGHDPDNIIRIPIDTDRYLTVDILPMSIISEVGYNEPQNESETGVLS
jgi:hypothetical protein